MIASEIIERCETMVDGASLTAPTHALCVDGTSATRKSSMLTATEMPVRKVGHRVYACDRSLSISNQVSFFFVSGTMVFARVKRQYVFPVDHRLHC